MVIVHLKELSPIGRLSDAQANSVLDAVFGGVPYTPVVTMYVTLSTTTPNNDGTNVTEPVGGNYSRVPYLNNATNWTTASGRVKSNANVVTFPTSSGSWGMVTSFALYDAASGGTFVAWGNLQSPQSIPSGATPDFPIGSLSVTAPGS